MRTSDQNMGQAVNGLVGSLGANLDNAWQQSKGNVDIIGKRLAAKNAGVLINYGCNSQCVNRCARNWLNMDNCLIGGDLHQQIDHGKGNPCDCPSIIDIEVYDKAEATVGISPWGIKNDD